MDDKRMITISVVVPIVVPDPKNGTSKGDAALRAEPHLIQFTCFVRYNSSSMSTNEIQASTLKTEQR
jgi:hypothetical protein